ncbi:MAG: hypothetical protein EXS35_16600 [Pedosphaera sp.]|nr:hypothetical protein [Pedosphaera sp.]
MSGSIVLALLLVSAPARGQGLDEQYLQIYSVIEQADTLSEGGKTELARAKYQEAQTALLKFKRDHPTWNVKTVSFRLNYLNERIVALSPKPVAPPPSVHAPEKKSEPKPVAKPAAPPALALVKLLEAGAEPRKAFRLQPKVGEKQTAVMTIKMASGIGVGDAAVTMTPAPAMQMTVSAQPKGVTAEGDINCDLVIEEISVLEEAGSNPQTVAALKTLFGNMKGIQIACTKTARGLIKKSEVIIPPGTDPMTRQALEQMKDSIVNVEFHLPAEAIGPGAKWEVRQKLKSQGMTIDETTTNELVSVAGDILTLKSSVAQSAALPKSPGTAATQGKVDPGKLTGTGSGTMTIDLAKLLPTQATMDGHAEIAMGARGGAQKLPTTIKSDTNIRLEAK